MSKQLSNVIVPGYVEISFKLNYLKPLHIKWTLDTYTHLKKRNDSIIKGFNVAGITEAIKFANDVFTRVENCFDEQR